MYTAVPVTVVPVPVAQARPAMCTVPWPFLRGPVRVRRMHERTLASLMISMLQSPSAPVRMAPAIELSTSAIVSTMTWLVTVEVSGTSVPSSAKM